MYPKTVWLPKTGMQRGAALGETGPGDVLTPGFPSVDGIYREPVGKLRLPSVPALPLSYGDALEILRRMDGKQTEGIFCCSAGRHRSLVLQFITRNGPIVLLVSFSRLSGLET